MTSTLFPRGGFFLVVCCAAISSAFSQTIIQSIPLPSTTFYNSAWGLTADSTALYIATNSSDATQGRKIIKLNFQGQAVDSVNAPVAVVSSQGLARDSAGNYYFARRYTSVVTIMKLSPSGTLLDSCRITRYVGGVAWDGGYLWYSVYFPDAQAGLYKLNFATKIVVDSILVPSLQPYGVTWDGTYLYYVENGFQGNPRGIFRVDPVAHDTAGFIPQPIDQTSNGTNPQDCAWDGRYMWLLAEPVGASSGRALYKYDLGGAGSPAINIPTKFFDIGVVVIGNTGQALATIQNTGTANLTIDSARITYSNRFTTNLTTPLTITPGNSSNFTITFSPLVYGADSAHIDIYHNDLTRPTQTIRVLGFGNNPPPVINVPASHDYGTRRVGSRNLWILTIQNQGSQTLVVDSAYFPTDAFYGDAGAFSFTIAPLASRNVRIWFSPNAASTYSDTMKIYSNAGNLPVAPIALSGQGDPTPLVIGTAIWSTTVPLHPNSNTTRRVRAVRAIGDITGDGKQDVIVCTDNYWTMAYNGNTSGGNDSLWAFNTYKTNYSAGPIGSEGDYSYQKALAIASDLDGDGMNDVVIGTGGGNEHVYALSGRTGNMIWTFGTDHPDSFSLGDITGVDVSMDFNNDGTPDVIAAGSATQSGGVGGRRSIYLFNGANGQILWQSSLPGFTHSVTAIPDVNGDSIPDVVGTVGQPSYMATAYSGANGNPLWSYPLNSTNGGGKEVLLLPIPGQRPDVILGAFWGPVYRINGITGSMVWQRPTGGKDPTRIIRLRDINGDGIDELVFSLLIGDAVCLDGATGNVLWSYPANSGMDITTIPDLNADGYDEVAVASQNAGILILRGNNGQLLNQYPFGGSEQGRSVAFIGDLDNNGSFEIIAGSDASRLLVLSGGLDAIAGDIISPPQIPSAFAVDQNYPNPFNPSTTLKLSIPYSADVNITIFDVLGRRVKSFEYLRLAPGVHEIVWDGTNNEGITVSSGMYLYQVHFGDQVLTKRMLMLK